MRWSQLALWSCHGGGNGDVATFRHTHVHSRSLRTLQVSAAYALTSCAMSVIVPLAGKCRANIDQLCLGVEPGENRLAMCLVNQLQVEAQPDFSGPHKL